MSSPNGWDRCAPLILEALEYDLGSHSLEDIREQLLDPDGGLDLWAGERSALVTEITKFPRLTRMHLWLCGGDMDELRAMLPSVESYGEAMGCTQFTTAGRPGWDRVMRPFGYVPAGRICVKGI